MKWFMVVTVTAIVLAATIFYLHLRSDRVAPATQITSGSDMIEPSTQCAHDRDCVVARWTTCGCENAVAVNKRYRDEYPKGETVENAFKPAAGLQRPACDAVCGAPLHRITKATCEGDPVTDQKVCKPVYSR